jgi:hypothetical protein
MLLPASRDPTMEVALAFNFAFCETGFGESDWHRRELFAAADLRTRNETVHYRLLSGYSQRWWRSLADVRKGLFTHTEYDRLNLETLCPR